MFDIITKGVRLFLENELLLLYEQIADKTMDKNKVYVSDFA